MQSKAQFPAFAPREFKNLHIHDVNRNMKATVGKKKPSITPKKIVFCLFVLYTYIIPGL